MKNTVRLHVDLPIDVYEVFEREAQRRNTSVEELMREMVISLVERLKKGELRLEEFKNRKS